MSYPRCTRPATGPPVTTLTGSIRIVQTGIEHGLRILTAQQEIGQEAGLEPLQNALDDEFGLLLRRLFLLLSLLYDAQAILRAERQLTQASLGSHALALEMLDVTLAGEHKAQVLSLVNPNVKPHPTHPAVVETGAGSRLCRANNTFTS